MEFVLSVSALQVGSSDTYPYSLLSVPRVRVQADSLMLPVLDCRQLRARGSNEETEGSLSPLLDFCPQRRRRQLVVVQFVFGAQVARTPSQKMKWCYGNGATTISSATVATATPQQTSRKRISLAGLRPWTGGGCISQLAAGVGGAGPHGRPHCGHSLPGSASVPLGTSAGLCFLVYSVRPAGSHGDLSTAASAVPGAVPSTLPTLPNVPELAWTLRAFFATERGSENYERLGTSDHCAQDRALGSEGQSLSS